MSYYGSWKIDDLLTFAVNTHNPETGAASDAAAAPSYRVYEDETATAILTGTMALLDAANTDGFYSEQLTLSAANGFEKGKSYHVYIEATVNSITGSISHTFQIEAEVDANSTSNVPPTVGSIADAVWDEAKAGHVTAGSFGEEVQDHALSTEISALNDLSAAQVNTEVDTALSDIGLDHLVAAAVVGADITDNSIVAQLVSKAATADWDNYDNTTESLEALRDQGDANWATGTVPIADAVWDEVIESSGPANAQTARELFRIMTAVMFGKTGSVDDWSARDVGDTKTRVSVSLDSKGHRTNIDTLDGS